MEKGHYPWMLRLFGSIVAGQGINTASMELMQSFGQVAAIQSLDRTGAGCQLS